MTAAAAWRWAVLDAAWHGVPAHLMLADDLPEARTRLADNAKIAGAEVREVPAAEAAWTTSAFGGATAPGA